MKESGAEKTLRAPYHERPWRRLPQIVARVKRNAVCPGHTAGRGYGLEGGHVYPPRRKSRKERGLRGFGSPPREGKKKKSRAAAHHD